MSKGRTVYIAQDNEYNIIHVSPTLKSMFTYFNWSANQYDYATRKWNNGILLYKGYIIARYYL